MPGDTPYSPEEIEELKRLFKEHAPPDGVITYKGRKVRLKPPEAKTVTVKKSSVTVKEAPAADKPGQPKIDPDSVEVTLHKAGERDQPYGVPDFTGQMMRSMREAAAKRALAPPHPPLDPGLLLHVVGDESEEGKKDKEDKET
mgnify:CR=1 FL=1